jgi:tetratricopeptide (TPR) repeat protein
MIVQGANALARSQVLTPRSRSSLLRKAKGLARILSLHATQPGKISAGSIPTSKLQALLALIRSPTDLQAAIAQLQTRYLVKFHTDAHTSSSLYIHDLTKLMIQENLRKKGTQQDWFGVALALICSAFEQIPDPTSCKWWTQCEILIPHIQSLTEWIDGRGEGNVQLAQANSCIAGYLWSRGRLSEAESLCLRVLSVIDKQIGANHPVMLGTMHNLAIVYELQARYSDAETVYKRVLAGRTKQLGAEHPDTLGTMHNLALVYQTQGRFTDAEGLYRRVLSARQKQLVAEHPVVLSTMHDLALAYLSQGRFGEAEALFGRVRAERERQLGLEHPDTLRTIRELAKVYRHQGRHEAAEKVDRWLQAVTQKEFRQ